MKCVAWNCSKEVWVKLLVAEHHSGREVADLRDSENTAETGDFQRNLHIQMCENNEKRNLYFARLGPDYSEDVLDAVIGAHDVLVDVLDLPVHEALQQVHHLLGGVERAVAGVQHDDAQLDVGQQRLVSVDLVQSEEESLQWLHPVLVLDPTTGQPALPLLVYGHCDI